MDEFVRMNRAKMTPDTKIFFIQNYLQNYRIHAYNTNNRKNWLNSYQQRIPLHLIINNVALFFYNQNCHHRIDQTNHKDNSTDITQEKLTKGKLGQT